MTSRDSVGGDDRLRLFLALRLPDDWLDALVEWQAAAFARTRARVVPRQHLHVTLVFLGSRPAAEVPAVVERLERAAAAAGPVELRDARYRETRAVAMLALDDVGGHGAALAEAAGRVEERPWLAHVTLARFRERPRVKEELPDTIRTGVLVPSDEAAYLSKLRPSGAEYEELASVRLGRHEKWTSTTHLT